jgi:hypothetical protein
LVEGIHRLTVEARELALLAALGFFLQTCLIVARSIRSDLPDYLRLREVVTAAAVFVGGLIGVLQFLVSTMYYLPASYRPEVADQLRVMNRIIFAQRESLRSSGGLASLSELSLIWEGEEIIPASVTSEGRYKDYQYSLSMDYPKQGFFLLDVRPHKYSGGLLSFHAYPPFADLDDSDAPDPDTMIYVITMADSAGRRATRKDRPFNRRYLHELIRCCLLK